MGPTVFDSLTTDDLAAVILGSEDFMWLMCGGDPQWVESHLAALRPAWHAWKERQRGY